MVSRKDSLRPIPVNYLEYLSLPQLATIRNVKMNGWDLFAIRRTGFGERVVLVRGPESEQFAVVRNDGILEDISLARIRKSDWQRQKIAKYR